MSNINQLVMNVLTEDYEADQASKFLSIPRSVSAHVDKMSEPQGDNPGYFGRPQLQSYRGDHEDFKIPGAGTGVATSDAEKAAVANFNKSHGERII